MNFGECGATILTKEIVSLDLFRRFIFHFSYMRFKENKALKIKPKKHFYILFWARLLGRRFYREIWFS